MWLVRNWRQSSSLYTRPWFFEGPKKFEWMKNLHSVLLDIKWIMFHDLLDIASDPLRRGGSDAKTKGHDSQLNCHWLLQISCYHEGDPNLNICCIFLNTVHFLFPLILRVHNSQNWISISHRTTLVWFQRPLGFHGHGFWSMSAENWYLV